MIELAFYSPVTAFAVLVLLLGGAGLGVSVRLPVEHLDTDSRDVVKYVLGLLSTMSAVLLSLLIASSKSSYDTQRAEMQEIATKVVLLDRTLAHYGPETAEARALLRAGMEGSVRRIWGEEATPPGAPSLVQAQQRISESFIRLIEVLQPRSDIQKAIQAQVLQTSTVIAQVRILMVAQGRNTLSLPFLVILVSWAVCLFIGYGLFARLNATVMTALVVGALAVSGAIFLIVELNRPYDGLLRIPESIMQDAIAMMGAP